MLVLLLVIGGLAAALLRGGGGPAQPALTPAQTTATAQTQATATFTSSLTATAQANTAATATVIAANPDPYPPSAGQLVLYDPLSDNSKGYDWDTGTSSNGTCNFTGGAYHISPSKTQFFYLCVAKVSNFSNFAFEVQINIVKGDCGGIIFRGDSAKGKFYFFDVCQDGSYRLYMYPDYSGTNAKELAGGSSPAIKVGLNQPQLLAVVAQGSALSVYMNKQKIVSVNDTTYSQGQIGLVADAGNNSTEVVFSNAKVWKL
jgi:eukaryotic-like serine/threonine-protein kinase